MGLVRFGLILVPLLVWAVESQAQNVSGYGTMPDPTLFLLREPAVHAELGLSPDQLKRLVEFNESSDGMLLATRNMQPAEGQKLISEVLGYTRKHVSQLFSNEQQTRFRQIMYRLRGLPFVLIPEVATQLELSGQQKADIESAVKATLAKMKEAQTGTFQGKSAFEETQRAIAAARKEEQDAILGTLSDKQKQKLVELVGRQFDPSSLGRVTFKAPDLLGGTEWINSSPLTLQDLRGKVVALHFWAFG